MQFKKVITYTAVSVLTGLSATLPVAVAGATSPAPMLLSVNTATGCSSHQATLPLSGAVNATVTWGDGTSTRYTTATLAKHTYKIPGRYSVRVTGTVTWLGSPTTAMPNSCITSVSSWGQTGLTSLRNAFYGDTYLAAVPNSLPTGVKDLAMTFSYTHFNAPIGNWNTANVTNMYGMFDGASAFNQPIGNWNTANVTNMGAMFLSATAFNQPVGSWNTAKVNFMYGMFWAASSFNQPIGNWNTAKVTDMGHVFDHATAFNQPVSSWNTANVTNLSGMFQGARAFNQPLSSWNTANVTDMSFMFTEDSAFNQPVDSWNTSKVTNMRYMFASTQSFNQSLASASWNTAKVTDMSGMFYGASAFNQPVGSWNTSSVKAMSFMFNYASSFNQSLAALNTANVADMSGIFTLSGLSSTNYGATLVGWAQHQEVSGVHLDAYAVTYPASAAAARQRLVNTNQWVIVDGGQA